MFCEVASLMVFKALRKPLCVTVLLINACSFVPALCLSPDSL
jgi:hypothetical protein